MSRQLSADRATVAFTSVSPSPSPSPICRPGQLQAGKLGHRAGALAATTQKHEGASSSTLEAGATGDGNWTDRAWQGGLRLPPMQETDRRFLPTVSHSRPKDKQQLEHRLRNSFLSDLVCSVLCCF